MMAAPTPLAVPHGLDRSRMKAWTEEAVWGHRLHNDQTPWLLLIELLNICAARDADAGQPLFPEPLDQDHEFFHYRLPKRPELRYLLFRDQHLDAEVARTAPSDRARWGSWLPKAERDSELNLGYLQERFGSFGAFASTAQLLRNLEVEPGRNRRWTSKHLVPHGPDAMMADIRERKTGEMDNDRRFFARGGELVFLMLSRSVQRDRLQDRLRTRLLDPSGRWNRLAMRLQPKDNDGGSAENVVGYLPIARHSRYDELAADWLALLDNDSLPVDYALEPLMRLTGLHVVLYMLERAAEVSGAENVAPFPLEMISTGANAVRKLSVEQFHVHRHATRTALESYIGSVRNTDAWNERLQAEKPKAEIAKLLHERFRWNADSQKDPESQLHELLDHALRNHANHMGQVPGFYVQQIGLGVTRRGAGRWYAPSDAMIEALVLANVEQPIELRQFLEILRERYRMVVGPHDARIAFGAMPVAEEQLKRNQQRFEERMRALGLLHRLSDDCAFVLNPFATATRDA